MPGLLNQNYITADQKRIRVNNAGVVNTLDPTSNPDTLQKKPGINISTSKANAVNGLNYVPVKNILEGWNPTCNPIKTSWIDTVSSPEFKDLNLSMFIFL